jgi:hypothetical protein
MANNEEIYNFLESNSFSLIEQDKSAYFGDEYKLFTNGTIEFRYASSKSDKTVDVRNAVVDGEWYDLALVKAYFNNEENLNQVTSLEVHNDFLKKNLSRINMAFSKENYPTTKEHLDEYGDKRAKQMFPGII